MNSPVVGTRRVGEKVFRGLGHAGLPASEMRFCPRPWSAGLTAQRPGAEGLPSQLRYHAKPEVGSVLVTNLVQHTRHTFP